MSRRYGTVEGFGRYYDFRRGVVGNVSDFQDAGKRLARCNNLRGRPYKAIGSVRDGYREIQNSPLDGEPTTLGKLVPRAGGNRLLVHLKTGAGAGKLSSITPDIVGKIDEGLPAGFTVTDKWWVMALLNGTLYGTQRGDAQLPLMYETYDPGGGAIYALDPMVLALPPGTTPVSTALAVLTGGVTPGYHWYRLRFRYRNGTSLAGPVFPVGGLNVTATNEQVNLGATAGIITEALRAAVKLRQDWVGWTVERTKVGAPYSGTLGATAVPTAQAPWYWVVDGTADTYSDIKPDADLFSLIDPGQGVFQSPPHLEGLIAYKNRLVGWDGYTLYASQAVNDLHATGPCNWDPELAYFVGEDGYDIEAVVQQGDRLLVLKRRDVYALEGDDPDTFRIRKLGEGSGCVGVRAAASFGGTVIALGETGFNTFQGDEVNPGKLRFGELEVGHYLDEMNRALMHEVVLVNGAGDYLLVGYPGATASYNDEALFYDLQTKDWRHDTNYRIRDALVQRDTVDFGGVPLLIADPKPFMNVEEPQRTYFVCQRWGTGPDRDLFAQKLDQDGNLQWPTTGVLIAPDTSSTIYSDACSDGADGMLVAYVGASPFRVRVARIRADGTVAWNMDVSTLSGAMERVAICPDGVGGAIVTWVRPFDDIYAQRVSHNGVLRWNSGAEFLSSTPSVASIGNPAICTDGSNGAIIAWRDTRAGITNKPVYGQRLNASGVAQWTANGKVLATDAAIGSDSVVKIAPDASGGAYVTWRDLRAGGTAYAYLTHVDAAGNLVAGWTANGNDVSGAPAGSPNVMPDSQGGVYIAWRDTAALRCKVRRYSADATPAWAATDALVITNVLDRNIAMVTDGAAGVILATQTAHGTPRGWTAQKINSAGVLQWGPVDQGVGTGDTVGEDSVGLANDGAGGCVLSTIGGESGVDTWSHKAMHVTSAGVADWTATLITAKSDDSSQVLITAIPAFGDDAAPGTEARYRIWRLFTGDLDSVIADGTGGESIPVMAETPWLDDGEPDHVKALKRLQVNIAGNDIVLTATLTLDMGSGIGQASVSIPVVVDLTSTIIGDEVVDGPLDLIIADEDGTTGDGVTVVPGLAGAETLLPFAPLPNGSDAFRYKLTLDGEATGDLVLSGFTLDGMLLPKRDLT